PISNLGSQDLIVFVRADGRSHSWRRLIRLMKKPVLLSIIAITLIFATALAQQRDGRGGGGGRGGFTPPPPPPPGPLVSLVQAGADAYNKGDVAYFEKMFADDILWVDEDGHMLTTKAFCVNFVRRQITATPKRTMTVSNISTGVNGDSAWAAFAYV